MTWPKRQISQLERILDEGRRSSMGRTKWDFCLTYLDRFAIPYLKSSRTTGTLKRRTQVRNCTAFTSDSSEFPSQTNSRLPRYRTHALLWSLLFLLSFRVNTALWTMNRDFQYSILGEQEMDLLLAMPDSMVLVSIVRGLLSTLLLAFSLFSFTYWISWLSNSLSKWRPRWR